MAGIEADKKLLKKVSSKSLLPSAKALGKQFASQEKWQCINFICHKFAGKFAAGVKRWI